ncbi:MAG: hypothetical protein NVS1B4_08130 [Gemmatimonadaceae bacterium]
MREAPQAAGHEETRKAIIALALGVAPPAPAFLPWPLVAAAAARERCLEVAWSRSGELIRGAAPAEVSASWRSAVLLSDVRARQRLAALQRLVAAFESCGVVPVVLKGLPLSQRLYGDPYLRPSADTDLYVPLVDREAVHAALLHAGYFHEYGEPPREGAYSRVEEDRLAIVEVHSSLSDDTLVAHLRFGPPQTEEITIDGCMLRGLSGRVLPAFLAVHLAKHQLPPLLWLIDFHTLWTSLDEGSRRSARQLATAAGARRMLEWTVGQVERTISSVGQPRPELPAQSPLRQRHNAVHVALLSDGIGDALHVVAAWALPGATRRTVGKAVATALTRLVRKPVSRVLRGWQRPTATRPAPSVARLPHHTVPGEALPLDRGQLGTVVGDVLRASPHVWLRARGGSMAPAIPHEALVRVGRPPSGPLQRGAVVLAELPGRRWVLHRVAGERRGTVLLWGDTMAESDPAIPRSRVAAVADRMAVGASELGVGRRPLMPFHRSARRAVRAWKALRRLAPLDQPGTAGGVIAGIPLVHHGLTDSAAAAASPSAWLGSWPSSPAREDPLHIFHRVGALPMRDLTQRIEARVVRESYYVDSGGEIAIRFGSWGADPRYSLMRTRVPGYGYEFSYPHWGHLAEMQWRMQRTAFMYALASRGRGMMAHATGFTLPGGQGVLCPGASGTGKSTLASCLAVDAEHPVTMVSDDRVALTYGSEEESVRVWGTPWPSSAGVASPVDAALGAVVLIRHGSTTPRIRRLSVAEALPVVLRAVAWPFWNDHLVGTVLEVLDRALSRVTLVEYSYAPGPVAARPLVQYLMAELS